MRLIIAGSRSVPVGVALLIVNRMIEVSGWNPAEVISGEADGPDTAGKLWARSKGIPCRSMPALWATYGNAAGHERNERMAAAGTHLLALWDAESRGTADMITLARGRGLPVCVLEVVASEVTKARKDEERRVRARAKRQRQASARASA